MDPTKSLVLAGALLASLGASASGQSPSHKLFRRVSTPRQATLDLATGTYTRGPVVGDRGPTTVSDLTNTDIFDGSGFGWVSVDTGGGSCTWFQMASKGMGTNQGVGVPLGPGTGTNYLHAPPPGSDLISNILFSYCSGALDVASGGVGGNVEIGLYEGYTVFGGAPTTTVAIVNLTGMPGNTAPGGFFGGTRCYALNVVYSPMVPFADSLFIGYSWHFMDTGTDGLYGATFPFLACAVSCSGLSILNGSAGGSGDFDGQPLEALGPDGQGMLDAFDAFCTGPFPNGPTFNTYTFATSGPFAPPFAPTTRATINLGIGEAAARATTNDNYNDCAPVDNLDTLTATPATVGQVWTASFTRAGGGSGRFQIRVWDTRVPMCNGIPPTTGSVPWPTGTGGRRMTVGTYFASLPAGQSSGGSPVAPTLPYTAGSGTATSGIPLELAFLGLHFACQARSGTGVAGTGTPRLSSAVEGTIGTF